FPSSVRVLSRHVLAVLFNDAPLAVVYTLSLHDALPIYLLQDVFGQQDAAGVPARKLMALQVTRLCGAGLLCGAGRRRLLALHPGDRKSTRLNSSHVKISYAVFCLKKKNGDS